jgi:hypothetical protein
MHHHNENSAMSDPEVEFIARALIAQHGSAAARAAVNHLNAMIDLGDFHRRDMWARVVHEIHEQLRRAGRPRAGGAVPFQAAVGQ